MPSQSSSSSQSAGASTNQTINPSCNCLFCHKQLDNNAPSSTGKTQMKKNFLQLTVESEDPQPCDCGDIWLGVPQGAKVVWNFCNEECFNKMHPNWKLVRDPSYPKNFIWIEINETCKACGHELVFATDAWLT